MNPPRAITAKRGTGGAGASAAAASVTGPHQPRRSVPAVDATQTATPTRTGAPTGSPKIVAGRPSARTASATRDAAGAPGAPYVTVYPEML